MTKRTENPLREQHARGPWQVAHGRLIRTAAIFAVVLSSVVGSTAFGQETAAPSGEARPPDAEARPSAPAGENPGLAPAANPGPEPAAAAQTTPAKSIPAEPWRAQKALGAPNWLRFGLEHRLRYENLENDFRAASTSDSRATSMRTLLSAELRFAPLVIATELLDSRVYATDETPLTNQHGDPFDVLQAYASLRQEGLLASGDAASLTVGRFTLDIGSRRLVARNEYRNTINAFTGIDAQWKSPSSHALRAFAVMPVLRLPSDAADLADNEIELDQENTDAIFSGIHFASAPLAAAVQLETYVFALHERDSADAPSANRRLYTPGVRVLRPPATGRFDFQFEGMLQLGTSRASSKSTDTTDLTHRAWAVNFASGYRFDAPWTPRVALAYDYATGDKDPNDKVNGRFDTLFGARRFEWGPTGLWGAFCRINVSSPGLRVEVAPHRTVDAMASYRLYWLASSRDAWSGAGLRDTTGSSGSFVGQQIETRIRWHVLPKNLAFDVGAAYIVRGGFAKNAPDSRDEAPLFAYSQVTVTL